VSATIGGAQTNTPAAENGFQPNRDYLALQPFEAIDTACGNVILTLTDLVFPGNSGRPLTFDSVFNNMPMGENPQHWPFTISGFADGESFTAPTCSWAHSSRVICLASACGRRFSNARRLTPAHNVSEYPRYVSTAGR
jgi:hypothetical protein